MISGAGWQAVGQPGSGRAIGPSAVAPLSADAGWVAEVVPLATAVAAVGSGLVAGLFLAFSIAVMPALRRLEGPAGIAAMQSINKAILNPVFGSLFGASTVLAALLAVATPVARVGAPVWQVAGGVLHVVGAFVVTVAVNVPLNNELAALDPASADRNRVWARFLTSWTAWNHARSVLTTAATVAFVVALQAAPS